MWGKWEKPECFPLDEDRPFLREHEWVILKLLCRPLASLAEADPEELSAASGGQISPERADELIRIVRISMLEGIGTWAARLLAEAGLSDQDLRTMRAEAIAERVNAQLGYPVWNEKTVARLAALQQRWRGDEQ
ncbi:MAG: hypothetical protein D6771_04300 [Zetaproteobacteria bacterium]|nr:MAG: hypothetical protein D6771_04300 [Zetaproteobacteria bacterium]